MLFRSLLNFFRGGHVPLPPEIPGSARSVPEILAEKIYAQTKGRFIKVVELIDRAALHSFQEYLSESP